MANRLFAQSFNAALVQFRDDEFNQRIADAASATVQIFSRRVFFGR